MAFVWTEELAVGVKVIDMQHKELFKRINSLVVVVESGEGAGDVEKTFDFLDDYVGAHFTTEEKAMAIYEYPARREHKMQHTIFIDAIEEARGKYKERGADAELLLEIKVSVCDWIVNHVLKVDTKLGAFLKDKL